MEYTVSQLAALSGVSPRTLRYYDEIGLLDVYKRQPLDRKEPIRCKTRAQLCFPSLTFRCSSA